MAVQDHIHLALATGAPPENAPTIKWAVQERLEIPNVIASVNRGVNGTLQPHRLWRNGNLFKPVDFRYKLRVSDYWGYTKSERHDFLMRMAGQYVYLTDVEHPDDGEDHTSYTKRMYISRLGEFPTDHYALEFFFVEVELMDATPQGWTPL